MGTGCRTPSQLIHRAKWKVLGLLAMRMKKVLELGFPGREARGRVNGFMSRNLPCMACDEGLNVSVDYSKLKVSAGELRAPEVTAQWADSGGILIFKQKRQPLKPLMYDDDRLYGFSLESGSAADKPATFTPKKRNGGSMLYTSGRMEEYFFSYIRFRRKCTCHEGVGNTLAGKLSRE